MVKSKGGLNPILLKCGLAVAFTFAGFLYSHFRAKRIKPPIISPKGNLPSHGSQVNLGGIRTASSSCSNLIDVNILDTEETCINKVVDKSSPRKIGEKEVETPRSKVGSPVAYASHEKDEYEQEIRKLMNMIRMLQERERTLEVQLLEYCGIREQETVVMELQNRLKISSMEAKMFNLKVDNLQSENRRLEAQVAGHGKVLGELEAAKTKIKFLKKKFKYESEQNKEQIINLKQRVSKFEDLECKTAATDEEIQMKQKRIKDLETEAEQLRKSYLRLQMENSDLARRLDSTQILANSVLENPEADSLKEESERLRQENEGLMKEIEQLQTDRCSDLEELVYLRWINACLRHELRNYQPPAGKTVARDLSKSLSPTSEKKAKQLIVEYANAEGGGSISDIDSDQWSSSQASFLTDSGECEEYSPLDNPSDTKANTTNNNSNKIKVFGKLMRLLRGKDSQSLRGRVASLEKSASRDDSNSPLFRSSMSTGNDPGSEGIRSEYETPNDTHRDSFDLNRASSLKDDIRRNSDIGGSSKNFSPRKRGPGDLKIHADSFMESSTVDKYNLIKYADALKDSSESPKTKVQRRTASYSSF